MSEQADDDVALAVARLQEALIRGDRATAEELVAEDFVYTGATGVVGRERWLALGLEEIAWEGYHFDSCRALLVAGSAVVVSEISQSGRLGERDIGGRFLVVDVWNAADPGWRLGARHSRRLA